MHAAALQFDLRIPDASSLKEKRRVVKPLMEAIRSKFSVGVAEVGQNDIHQRAAIGIAIVAGEYFHITKVTHQIERFVASVPGVEVIAMHVYAMEEA